MPFYHRDVACRLLSDALSSVQVGSSSTGGINVPSFDPPFAIFRGRIQKETQDATDCSTWLQDTDTVWPHATLPCSGGGGQTSSTLDAVVKCRKRDPKLLHSSCPPALLFHDVQSRQEEVSIILSVQREGKKLHAV